MLIDVDTFPHHTWAHCPRCGQAKATNYPGMCFECRENFWEAAWSYGGTDEEISARFGRLGGRYDPREQD